MAPILHDLDREWSALATSARARRAVIRWARAHSVLAGRRDLADVLEARLQNEQANGVLRALAVLAPTDDLAARALLQAMVPGLVRLAATTGSDDPAAIDELVALAWERIRTYPAQRQGSVAGNILLDTRKRYRAHRAVDAPKDSVPICDEPREGGCSPEDEVAGRLLIEQLAAGQRAGLMSPAVLATIIRTRLGGERLADIAAEQHISPRLLCHRRWRAECRLRELPLAG